MASFFDAISEIFLVVFVGLVFRVICAGFGLHFGRYFSGYLEVMLVLVDIFWKMLHPAEVSQIAVRLRVERLEK